MASSSHGQSPPPSGPGDGPIDTPGIQGEQPNGENEPSANLSRDDGDNGAGVPFTPVQPRRLVQTPPANSPIVNQPEIPPATQVMSPTSDRSMMESVLSALSTLRDENALLRQRVMGLEATRMST